MRKGVPPVHKELQPVRKGVLPVRKEVPPNNFSDFDPSAFVGYRFVPFVNGR